MKKKPLLTDLEDHALAACDDMYLETPIVQEVLASWHARVVPTRELRAVFKRLSTLGLLKTYAKKKGRYITVELTGHKTQEISVRATAAGRKYLADERHVL